MSTITNFRDLRIFQQARVLHKEIYQLSKVGDFAKDFRFKDQINAASGSIMDNIAEGFERDGNKEFYQFLSISKGSCGEVQSQLIRSVDIEYITQDDYEKLNDIATEISASIGKLMWHLKQCELKGIKYK